MRLTRDWGELRSWGVVSGIFLSIGCASTPQLTIDDGEDKPGGTGGKSGGMGGGIDIPSSGGSPTGTGGGATTGSCGDVSCGSGQSCVDVDGAKSCVNNECADLTCTSTQECQPAPGGGNYCVRIACSNDSECPLERFCNGTICVADTCAGGSRTCSAGEVVACGANGGTQTPAYTCGSAGYFTSSCDASATTCTCEDDWDCPNYTTCEAGACAGTGKAPTCTLDPVPFENVLPQLEFRWGGTNNANPAATGRPFTWSGQVASTPAVANLDDDNGDGKIDELDFPEIIFMSYGPSLTADGVVRALHGGGPAKGQDYFALCGGTHWKEGDPLTDACVPIGGGAAANNNAFARPAGMVAVGDLDGDGYPEIVAPNESKGFMILDNKGALLLNHAVNLAYGGRPWNYPAPAIANLDHAGLSEIIIGNRVITLKLNGTALEVDKVFTGTGSDGTMLHGSEEGHHGPMVCVADLDDTKAGLEFVAGMTAYRLPDVADCGTDPTSDYCTNKLTQLWDAPTVNGSGSGATQIGYANGFCAVADVWGADTAIPPGPSNALDQKPEAVIIGNGSLYVLNGKTGALVKRVDLGGGTQGGAPNIDDFDGDGFPEVAAALSAFYAVTDFQTESTECPLWPNTLPKTGTGLNGNTARAPAGSCTQDSDCASGMTCNEQLGECVCLHNGWKRATEDDSSKVTSSSVFDFNGDGAAEVVYNDECYFRIYDGSTGLIYFANPSLSRTIIENPVVADLDNDGNAEIVFVQNNETLQCGETNLDSWPSGVDDVARNSLPNGLEVWGDPSDVWVSARRVWNENAYHVTNVLESGGIPVHEPESWKPLNGRLYNTYRSQPRSFGVAPDLTLAAVQISSPNVACGALSDTIEIAVDVRNQGDLRVGPGVPVQFFGTWGATEEPLLDAMGDPLVFTLVKSLEPGASLIISVPYEAGQNPGRSTLPDSVRAVVDPTSMSQPDGSQRECVESNNEISGNVDGGSTTADLLVTITNTPGCGSPMVNVTVDNDGTEDATDVLVRIFAGDPSAGGRFLGEKVLTGTIAPGGSKNSTVTLPAIGSDVILWAIVDPLNEVPECNDGNNGYKGPLLNCNVVK